ncbi:unnamed protein product [Trypanosoma congolense IL3000]|uniref:WGS project CAEQ00000000 data, annotated contig 988 n=1 Tax=Trypanosoma congolense (strain IL3000) TaxID=1068625 RepID=F9WK58_TRYCI|nr:unnamed protein product [Trypanosoma congolense IL3000]
MNDPCQTVLVELGILFTMTDDGQEKVEQVVKQENGVNEESVSPASDFWWTHRSLLEEVKEVETRSFADATIMSCTGDLKERAHIPLVAASSRGSGAFDAAVSAAMALEWHEGVAAARNKLLTAFVEMQQQSRTDSGQFGKLTADSVVVISEREVTALRQDALHFVLRVIIEEWRTHFTALRGDDADVSLSCLVDNLLVGMTFTHTACWRCTSHDGSNAEEDREVLDAVCGYLRCRLRLTLVERAHMFPKFTQYVWDSFSEELQELGSDMLRVCNAGETAVEISELQAGDVDRSEINALIGRTTKVLGKVEVGTSLNEVPSEHGNKHNNGYVVVTTPARIGGLVQPLAKWLPFCGKFLHSLLQQCCRDNKKEGNSADAVAKGGGTDGDGHVVEAPSNSSTVTTSEVRSWIRALQQEVQRIFALLVQLDAAAPWFVLLSDAAMRAFFLTREELDASGDCSVFAEVNNKEEARELSACRAFLRWHNRVVGNLKLFPAGTSGTHQRQLTLLEACGKAMSSIISSALDRTSAPSDVHRRALCVLLFYRPIATMRHLVTFLCPLSAEMDRCDFEAAVTDKSMTSASRSSAFGEESLKDNDVAFIFFPKFFSIFCFVEHALANVCAELKAIMELNAESGLTCNNDANVDPALKASRLVEQFFAAAFEECVVGVGNGGGGYCDVSISEWLMFLAFVASDTPIYDTASLHHVRQAARRILAPGVPMMSCLHRLIRQRQQHGLVAFFLPPLRAIGVDHSTAENTEYMACALRYPRSAEVAYLCELPRGYYSRQPQRLALNAKNDALHFFHNILMITGSLKRCRSGEETAKKDGEDCGKGGFVVRQLFIEIVAHIGGVVMQRLQGNGEQRPVGGPGSAVLIDAMVAFFLGVMRLCGSVTYWDVPKRQEIQRAIVQRMIDTTSESQTPSLTQSLLSLLFGGRCTPGEEGMFSLCGDSGSGVPHAVIDCFWRMELEDLDTRVTSSAMSLLRTCNRSYMKSIPTKTLLACRAMLEQYTAKEKELTARTKVKEGIETCIIHDLKLLRQDASVHQETKEPQQPTAAVASSEAEGRQEGITECADAANEHNAAREGCETSTTEKSEVVDIPSPETRETDKKDATLDITARHELSADSLESYINSLLTMISMRARISVVDGLFAGVALKNWLMLAEGRFDGRMLLIALRRMVLRVSAKLPFCTKGECAALAAFLGSFIEEVALPYKLSFSQSAPSPNGKELQKPTTPSEQAKQSELTDESSSEWTSRVLPASEKDASALLHTLIVDTTRNITRFLGENTMLGDWKAYALTLHTRRIIGLVKRYQTLFKEALDKRQKVLVNTSDKHPVKLLAALELPLLEKMMGPAVSTEWLLVATPQQPATPSAAVAIERRSHGSTELREQPSQPLKRGRDREGQSYEAGSRYNRYSRGSFR